MISAVVLAPTAWRSGTSPGDVVARSLPWLVSAVVAGIVRDVTLAASPAANLTALADHVGCGLVEAETDADAFGGALAQSRCLQVFVIKGGHQPIGRLSDELEAHESLSSSHTASLLAVPSGLAQRLLPRWSPVVGVLAPKSQALAAGSFVELARACRHGPRFATRAMPVT